VSLTITRISLEHFRSCSSVSVELDPRLTVIVGPNAVGKTNIVEAIQLLTAAESFRRPLWSDVVEWGAAEARAQLEASGDSRALTVELTISCQGRRSYRVNGKARRKIADTAGVIPCVLFTPEDLRLVKDSSERRRETLDSVGRQLSPAYAATRLDYDRILRHRNAVLKDETASVDTLEAWTEQLVSVGAALSDHRVRLFERIAGHLGRIHEEIASGQPLEARYRRSWDRDGAVGVEGVGSVEAMRQALGRRATEERARGTTVVGPHRDDIEFRIEGRDARTFASQGQQRSVALAWKLAELAVIQEISGQPPVLLLDDVMSELDEQRRHALTRFVGEAAQTVVTTTNLGYFEPDLIARARVVELP
jgi:DNA replication and repair protein RecF